MTGWSILAGVLGVLATELIAGYLGSQRISRGGTIYWLLGILALLPAWLIPFLDLLARTSGPRPEKALIAAWMLSSSSALLGVIVTDAVLKCVGESERDQCP